MTEHIHTHVRVHTHTLGYNPCWYFVFCIWCFSWLYQSFILPSNDNEWHYTCVRASHCSHARLFVTLWTVAHQTSLPMRFCRQEYCSGLPCPPPGDLPNPGIELVSLTPPALASGFFISVTPGKPSLQNLPANWSERKGKREEIFSSHTSSQLKIWV